jgi:formylglycine-generating enzyme required for sulfatase activity
LSFLIRRMLLLFCCSSIFMLFSSSCIQSDNPDKSHNAVVHPVDGVGITWVGLSGGSYTMSCNAGFSHCLTEDNAPKVVNISPFEIAQTETTQRQFEKVMENNPSYHNFSPDHPVDHVSWFQAQEFCKIIRARLPTDTEWEYAARAQTTTRYFCGNDPACLDDIAWWKNNSDNKPHRVATKKPNAFMLHDMLGNVREWVDDYYTPTVHQKTSINDDVHRAWRGSCYYGDMMALRSSVRNGWVPEQIGKCLGFRCARDPMPRESGLFKTILSVLSFKE